MQVTREAVLYTGAALIKKKKQNTTYMLNELIAVVLKVSSAKRFKISMVFVLLSLAGTLDAVDIYCSS